MVITNFVYTLGCFYPDVFHIINKGTKDKLISRFNSDFTVG